MNRTIHELQKEQLNQTTGGDSYPSMRATYVRYEPAVHYQNKEFQINLEFTNSGSYPLDNVRVKGFLLEDYNTISPYSIWTDLALSGLNISNVIPNQAALSQFSPCAISFEVSVMKPGQTQSTPLLFDREPASSGLNIFIESNRQAWLILFRELKSESSQYYPIYHTAVFRIEDKKLHLLSGSLTGIKWFSEAFKSLIIYVLMS